MQCNTTDRGRRWNCKLQKTIPIVSAVFYNHLELQVLSIAAIEWSWLILRNIKCVETITTKAVFHLIALFSADLDRCVSTRKSKNSDKRSARGVERVFGE